MEIQMKDHDELLALTDEQVEAWVDLECAKAGVPFLPALPVAQQVPKAEPDVTLYQIGGLLVGSREDAEKIQDALRGVVLYRETYAPGGSYSNKIAERAEGETEAIRVQMFSASRWAEVRESVRLAKEKTAAYEAALKEYNRVASEREEVADEIRSAIHEAWSRKHRRDEMDRHLARYLKLANGDEAVAHAFLAEAYPRLVEEFLDGKPAPVPAFAGSVEEETEAPF